jgi:hypothetical protein
MNDAYARGVRFFQRHVVPIQFEFTKGDAQRHYALITSYLVSVRGTWLLLTVAHCIEDVQENIDSGCTVRCWLVDCGGQGAKHKQMVPFDWGDATPARLFKDPDIDIGVVWVRDLFKGMLVANGVEPFTELAWDYDPPERVDVYMLMGVPAELAEPASLIATFTPVALPVIAAATRPPDLNETAAERWYGYVGAVNGLSDIYGMSGGPILAIAKDSGGADKYWLFAMQCAWHRPTRAIAAIPTRPALRMLAEHFEQVAAES